MYSNEIIEIIKEYLNNTRAEYAVMINGEWGSGKTYFLRHSLLKVLESIDSGKKDRRKFTYISLYGVKSVEEISKEIIFSCFGPKNSKKVETVNSVLETAGNIVTASFGAINVDVSKVKDTLAKVDIHNWLLCFDDLERCCIPINEMLGYINRLVEHNHGKVIVLANEQEIGKVTLNENLESKCQVVLSGRKIVIGKKQDKGNKNTVDDINIDKLKEVTESIFSDDILYKSIREKVIGLTVRFDPQMDKAFDSIISDMKVSA